MDQIIEEDSSDDSIEQAEEKAGQVEIETVVAKVEENKIEVATNVV